MRRLFKAEFVLIGAGVVTIGLADPLGHWASVVGVLGVGLAGVSMRPRTPPTAAAVVSIGGVLALAFLINPIPVGLILIALGAVGLLFAVIERTRARARPSR
jgi:hypothetical protein